MKKFLSALSILILAMGSCAPLAAQTHIVPVYSYPAAGAPPTVVLQCDDNQDNCTPVSTTNPLKATLTGSSTGASAQQVQGNGAAGAAKVGNPVRTGGTVQTGTITAQTAGQSSDFVTDDYGNQRTRIVGTLVAPSSATTTVVYCQGASSGSTSTANIGPCAMLAHVWDGTNSRPLAGDASGLYAVEVPSASTNAGVAVNATSVAAGSLIVKASPGNLYGYNVTSAASAGYVMIFNSATVPADGTVTPARCIPLAANTGLEVDLRGQPTFFSAGIVIVFSTTGCFTKTISATAFIAGDAK